MFFTPDSAYGSFAVHFSNNPASHFGVWARGYSEAATRLCDSLLAEPGFGDNDAYPVVFLYRHALELYLKGVIIRGNLLCALKDESTFCEELKLNHRLLPLYEAARRLLEHSFPDDVELRDFLAKLQVVISELHALDPGSYNFRYPVNKNAERPAEGSTILGLVPLRATMAEILEAFDSIDTLLHVEVDVAQDALSYLDRDAS